MRNTVFIIISLLLTSSLFGQDKLQTRIHIDAGEQIATVSKLFNGTNIEDLNNQTNGGMFSQLIHGEAFEENVDVDFLNLDKSDYSKIYIMLDERRIPHLITQTDIYSRVNWNNLSEKYDFHSKDIYNTRPFREPRVISGWSFPGRFLVYDSLPPAIQKTMLERINGNEQISKYWSKLTSGSPQYKYELRRDGQAYIGRQSQLISFTGGSGEVGITNHGLYRMGIRFDAGKPYDGILRVKAEKAVTLYLSLRDEKGAVLAEKPYQLKGNGSYEKIDFELIPNKNTINGSFGIALKNPGEVSLGFAFLQPGEWGRVNGFPIRKMFTDALQKQGITAFRYNGSMVDVGADTYLYRWKKMIGPVDERRVTFRSGFNPYATHSFGFIEMLQAAESINAIAIIGMSMDETYEDIRDFVEYVNGSTSSKWGALRAKHGHPEPYNLKYIQVDNERPITRGYVECMKKFAEAAWEVDSNMSIMTSLNIGGSGYKRGGSEYQKQRIQQLEKQVAEAKQQSISPWELDRLQQQLEDAKQQLGEDYKLASELAGWFISKGKGDKLAWDPHYSGALLFADRGDAFLNEMGINLQAELAKDHPGFKLNLHPMEENGSRCDWDRGLAHAHNWNTLQRYGDCFQMLGTANTFQPHNMHYMWDQGRIHYTADTIWFQPSAHIDEMMMKTWKPYVVKAVSDNDTILDVTAKINEAKTEMTIYIANLSDQPQEAILNIDNFRFNTRAEVQTIGGCELTEFNTYENMNNVVFKPSRATISRKGTRYTFPKYSYTVITLKR
ncbi:alpha-N-arabinofuranosidase [Parabacteroides sp. PF5-5]|uniref:alpha-L-arabinofuranosidase C-terminal domain-containing protein n=1 Tax=unclassified Parabacteroides TaxID=2649774 RepID=UPI0024743BFA|nr:MULTISPECIES: alpha-L-arabinofuranosidase C-terminal domain-containing protein [unclassified Parabacteroides]MDH6304304.1 alpha-N-arabinofuranosidase [Parabacteroides sp. PH5-39]MDH6315543.1 alpha-N-arabinofuranosidase [Parabacteroides sp. PF5-13]MDH6318963.1 alpha-N-arabinofuranosidase [Parabacteroides sp. PH5-13]MDH6322692.1 alpha-N-arabinofuranosidase [Parabacteroides sp. PH5-8]MDH6326736.1 alpha-N-arabinofuranosidase [Parabacteroides sp. PH5-41]